MPPVPAEKRVEHLEAQVVRVTPSVMLVSTQITTKSLPGDLLSEYSTLGGETPQGTRAKSVSHTTVADSHQGSLDPASHLPPLGICHQDLLYLPCCLGI